MTRTIGVGVVGMGWMGMTHSRAYRQIEDRFAEDGIGARLVVCADDVQARSDEARSRFGFERSVNDWREVMTDPEVEVVDITAPNFLHSEIATAAAAAGKHIFCEKPVGRNPNETATIEEAARSAGVKTFTGYNYRWLPMVQYAHQLIQEGRIGDLTHYRGRFFAGYGSNPHSVLSWRFQEEVSGLGALGDLMSHAVDMAHMIAGPIEQVIGNQKTFIADRPVATPGEGTHFSVNADGPRSKVTNEDYVGLLARFANGAQGTFEVCRVIVGPQCQLSFEVHGTKGALSWDFERMNELEVFLPEDSDCHDGYARIASGPGHPFHANFNPGPAVGLGYEDSMVIELYHFLKSIVDDKQGTPGFAEALAVARVAAAAQRSWESERWEKVTPLTA